MSLPLGFKYYNNMAIYLVGDLRTLYIKDYREDLEGRYDQADKILYRERIFCLDCFDFKTCRKFWQGCPYRAKAMKIIRR